ncbi:MAG: uracil-DNA glycosylase family protein [Clostridia bacterium]|jgi:uracil-DNA glycosylase family 4|nr:hypothetical protein [Clostridia bacterium]MDD4276232.1 uracil-DNA glycosylase family protein [Clostridia bacterium]
MNKIQEKINTCTLCGDLPKLSKQSVVYGKSKIIVIGESPAKNGWLASGNAFYDLNGKILASGRVLEKLLDIVNLKISDIYFTECCKCLMVDRKQLEKCSQNCLPFLIQQLNKLDCNIILTMGLMPSQTLLKTKIKKYSDFVGKPQNIKLGSKEYLLLPIYHPSPANPKGYKGNISIFEYLKTLI